MQTISLFFLENRVARAALSVQLGHQLHANIQTVGVLSRQRQLAYARQRPAEYLLGSVVCHWISNDTLIHLKGLHLYI